MKQNRVSLGGIIGHTHTNILNIGACFSQAFLLKGNQGNVLEEAQAKCEVGKAGGLQTDGFGRGETLTPTCSFGPLGILASEKYRWPFSFCTSQRERERKRRERRGEERECVCKCVCE